MDTTDPYTLGSLMKQKIYGKEKRLIYLGTYG